MIELLGLHKTYGARAVLSNATHSPCTRREHRARRLERQRQDDNAGCAVASRGRLAADTDRRHRHAARPCDARARLSYLAQRTDFPSTLTVREILRVVADLRCTTRAVDRELSLCGLTQAGRTDRRPVVGRERQRIAIAALFIPDVAHTCSTSRRSTSTRRRPLLVTRLALRDESGRAVLFTTHATASSRGWQRESRCCARPHRARREDLAYGERHLSIAIDGRADRWVGTAFAGAPPRVAEPRPPPCPRPDVARQHVLAWLEHEGARSRVIAPRAALAAALERLERGGTS